MVQGSVTFNKNLENGPEISLDTTPSRTMPKPTAINKKSPSKLKHTCTRSRFIKFLLTNLSIQPHLNFMLILYHRTQMKYIPIFEYVRFFINQRFWDGENIKKWESPSHFFDRLKKSPRNFQIPGALPAYGRAFAAQRTETYLCRVFRTAPGPAYSSAAMPSMRSPSPAAYKSTPNTSALLNRAFRQLIS